MLLALLMAAPGVALAQGPSIDGGEFIEAAPQGFGDRHNSWAWSMQWWNGHLYVGTNRAFRCVEMASLNRLSATLFPYPPDDPDLSCTPEPSDLPLQAEIWRWTPSTDTWERVFQSPAEVPFPGGKMIARDIGFRGMIVFQELDGTEALYVTTVSPQFAFSELQNLPARILRSTDGVHFEPIPQDPGTAFGNFPLSSLRNPVAFQGKLYVIAGAIQGSGYLLESDDPAAGNDSFRVVNSDGLLVSAAMPYNGRLYVGTRSLTDGYGVYWTDAQGDPPYTFHPVVENGGYLIPLRNVEALSMQEFRGDLYVGANGIVAGPIGWMAPAELIRVHPDDTWELVVGYPRQTPDGWKIPISGLDAGFGWFLNGHMWRMEVFEDHLYVGTFDSSTTFKDDSEVAPLVEPYMGFDLYRTADGAQFEMVTEDGFGDPYSFGVRTMAATPYGLFLGTANPYYGLRIWRVPRHPNYIPAILRP